MTSEELKCFKIMFWVESLFQKWCFPEFWNSKGVMSYCLQEIIRNSSGDCVLSLVRIWLILEAVCQKIRYPL